jgi:Lrp/AsnC family leucine-responsive transcriptional regulator
MDEIDRKIAIAVQQDGAAGLSDLAKVSGLSVSATAERVKRLEERGVIRGWHAALDPGAAGCPLLAFLRVAIRPGQEEIAFRQAVLGLAAVLECHQTTGEWSYLVKLRAADIAALDALLSGEIRPLAGIERVAVEVAMATVKETMLLPVLHQPEEET